MNDDTNGSAKYTKEIAIPLGKTEAGDPVLVRVRDDEGPKEASVGVLRPVQDGVPLPPGADMLKLEPCEGTNHYHVKTLYESPDKPALNRGGGWKPMKVSRQTFESNWDRIFGGRKPDPKDLN